MTLDELKTMYENRNAVVSSNGYGVMDLSKLPPDPVYEPEVIQDVITGLKDPNSPAYANPYKFKYAWDRKAQAYREATAEEKAVMAAQEEEAKAQWEVGEITDLGEFESLDAVPSELRLKLAGSIAGDDAVEAARMAAYDAAEAAGLDPTQTTIARVPMMLVNTPVGVVPKFGYE